MQSEVIVVGAGPAGSTTALELSRRGVRVTLVDRAGFPRDKACGDAVSPRAIGLLREIGVKADPDEELGRILFRSPHELIEQGRIEQHEKGALIPRFDLDERILNEAIRNGTRFENRTTAHQLIVDQGTVLGIRLSRAGGPIQELRAPLTIIAEGAVDGLTRTAPVTRSRPHQVGFAVRRYLKHVDWGSGPKALEMVIPLESGRIPLTGYAWAFPTGMDLANVGVGYLRDEATPKQIRSLLYRFESLLKQRDPRFSAAVPASSPLGAPVRIGGIGRDAFGPGILLVGDSAGLANPFWAEGIAPAIESGRVAAETAHDFLRLGHPLSDYADRLERMAASYCHLSGSLPLIHHGMRHVGRDLAEFIGAKTPLAKAVFEMLDLDAPTTRPVRSRPRRAAESSVLEVVRSIDERLIRVAGRGRPLFGDLVRRITRQPEAPRCAVALVASRAQLPGFSGADSKMIRAAVCLELVCNAAFILGSGSIEDASTQAERGGAWLEATLGLSLADQLLARAFAIATWLPDPDARCISEAMEDVVNRVASAEFEGVEGDLTADVCGIGAAVGASLGGADDVEATAVGVRASGAVSAMPGPRLPDDLACALLEALRDDRSGHG